LRLVEQTQVVLREIEALKIWPAAAISRVCRKRWISALFHPGALHVFPHERSVPREFPEIELEIHESANQPIAEYAESDAINAPS
jgi:LysR family hydrogen peroxide-inducible transcriptional activator